MLLWDEPIKICDNDADKGGFEVLQVLMTMVRVVPVKAVFNSAAGGSEIY